MSTYDQIQHYARETLDLADAALATAQADVEEWRGTADGLGQQLTEAQRAGEAMAAELSDLHAVAADKAAEVEQVRAELAAAKGDIETVRAALAGTIAERDAELAAVKADNLRLVDLAAECSANLDAANATIAELRAQLAEPEPTPEPSPVVTVYGSCPAAGGSSLAAAQTVLTKWGAGAAIRQFFSGGFTANPNHPSGAGIVHTSYKPDVAAVNSGALDAAITALAKATPAGDVLEIWHEADLKVRKGTLDKAAVIAAKNRFHDLVKAANPAVLTCTTYTGWLFEPDSGLDPQEWAGVRADLLGVDLDGITVDAPPYPDWGDEIPAVKDCVARWGYAGWCVPELGAPRAASGDSSGTVRAAWMTAAAKACEGAVYVAAFEYPTVPGYELTSAAEIAAWKALI